MKIANKDSVVADFPYFLLLVKSRNTDYWNVG